MMQRPTVLPPILGLCFAAALAAPAQAQVRVHERANWSGVESIASGGWHDATRNLLVLSSLGELKEWDGPGTARSTPMPAVAQATACEFPLVPGAGLVWNAQIGTLRYAGGSWTQLVPPGQPIGAGSSVVRQRMAWDAQRGRAVLLVEQFGLRQCFQFDGTAWTPMPVPPGVELFGGMVFDASRNRVLVLTDAGAFTWSGGTWDPVATIPGPYVYDRALAWDAARQRIVAFGGYVWNIPNLTTLADTWEWDGAQWTLRTPTTSPSGRSGSSLVYDRLRQRCFLFGGDTGHLQGSDEVWAWDGTTWVNWSASTVRPAARNDAMLAEDESRGSILFGGRDANNVPFGDTWLWEGDRWLPLNSVQNPAPRSAGGMARSGFNSTMLFGGMDGNGNPLGDTWTFAGGWQLRAPAFAPSPRLNHAMVSAVTANSRVWLFGGTNGTTWFDDLWYFDNANPTWILTNSQPRPPARDIHAMAFDERRNRLVVFGGRDALGQALDDTWEYDIALDVWSQPNPPSRPQARFNAAMVYDPLKCRTTLVGGYDPASFTFLDDLHEWDGTRWTQVTPSTRSVRGAENFAACYDRYTNRTVLFGGQTGFGAPVSDTTWELQEHVGRSALAQAHGSNLSITGQPVVGMFDTPLRVEIPASGLVSALLVDVGPRPVPYAVGMPPLFCSAQDLHVQGLVSYLAIGNPGQVSLPLPAAAAGWVISFQGVGLAGSGCVDVTEAWYARIRSM